MELRGARALVVGLGKSGGAAARLLLREGASVAVADAKQVSVPEGARFAGAPRPEVYEGIDLVVKSPGVPRAALQGARGQIIGEIELAFRFLREPVVGITGTNGKSTTTALTGHLLRTAGLRAFVGGNLGTALSERVLTGGDLDASVCELSSFQLEDVRLLRCAAAAVLNVTPDHFDRYASMDDYAAAKARIFERQRPGDLAVLNADDEWCRKMTTLPGVRRALFTGKEQTAEARSSRRAASPEENNLSALRVSAVCIFPGTVTVDGADYRITAKTLRGAHNAQNAMAALLMARHLGVAPEALQRGLDTYPGLPHRLEPVRTLNGVEWVNDSKATNVDSVEKALGAFEGGLFVIMGGRGKGAPYAPLRPLFSGRVKNLLTIGEDARRIEEELGDLAPVQRCGDIESAVAWAHGRARSGDVVLLAPACASYDQFKNFEERGERFKMLVRSLA